MNEMRLVEITARAGHIRPFDLSMRSNLRQHALKTPDSAEQLRCQPHVTAKLFDKMFVTDSNLIDHVADAYWIRREKLVACPEDATLLGFIEIAPGQTIAERALKDRKLRPRTTSLQKALAQFRRRPTPNRIKRDDLIPKFISRKAQDGSSAPGLEMHADHR